MLWNMFAALMLWNMFAAPTARNMKARGKREARRSW